MIDHTANGQQPELMVVLTDQADLRQAADLATKNVKSRYVRDALWNKSQATQEPILEWLRERGVEHRSFYIINAILIPAHAKQQFGTSTIMCSLATPPIRSSGAGWSVVAP